MVSKAVVRARLLAARSEIPPGPRGAADSALVTQLDSVTLPLQIVPALAAALLARFTSFGIACAAGLGIGILNSLINYASAQTWFPTSNGTAIPGVQELVAFLIIIAAMFLRGARIPS